MNQYFQFKKFRITQETTSMKVTTDACLFGGWIASELNEKTKSILDIGAGTGLLSLMVAQEHSCNIDAIEIEPNAAAEAKKNVSASPWKERITIIEADIRNIPIKKYDCIISNPPFYENDLKAASGGKNIAYHSQELNLEELIRIISRSLNEAGCFFLLLPFRRKDEIDKLMEAAELFIHEIVWVYHSRKHKASRIMIKGGPEERVTAGRDLFIKDEAGNYAPEFVELLKGYYLYL